MKKCWCIPPEHNAAFVAAMEDVLSVYSRPYDEKRLVICMDEKPVQLFASARKSIRSKDGRTTMNISVMELPTSFYLQSH